MLLSDLLSGHQIEAGTTEGPVPVKGIAYDSRQVKPGYIFVAIKGFKTDGHQYIEDAVSKGAAAIVTQREVRIPEGIPWVRIADTRKGLARMAARFYGFPCDKMRVIGVTGTNGKTTTTYMIREVYKNAGKKTGLIGTINNMIGEKVLPVKHTTPESVDLQKFMAQMVKEQVEAAVMEVSSHALSLHRVEGCHFDIGVFTNITQDHLDFHRDMEDYLAAKTRLFAGAGTSIINADSDYCERISKESGGKVVTYGMERQADVMAREINISPAGVSFRAIWPGGDIQVDLQLTGLFNVYNALAAFSVGLEEGLEPEGIKEALEALEGVPGRFELVNKGQPFAVIVDYAHTPDGLENILSTARQFTSGRLITVFGCGGDRDRTKRPLMGKLGVELSDLAVITSDNPRTEDPGKIIEDILEGVDSAGSVDYTVIQDRGSAIGYAIKSAQAGDVVVIAGKGHETYQEINGERFHFDDREEAGIILEELGGGNWWRP